MSWSHNTIIFLTQLNKFHSYIGTDIWWDWLCVYVKLEILNATAAAKKSFQMSWKINGREMFSLLYERFRRNYLIYLSEKDDRWLSLKGKKKNRLEIFKNKWTETLQILIFRRHYLNDRRRYLFC